MPARRPARLTPPDVDALRAALGQGKIVQVGITPSSQFPGGTTGRVRRIGTPALDGEEFLFVEVPVNGAKDILPFAPGDLTGSPPRMRPAEASTTGSPLRSAPTSGRSPERIAAGAPPGGTTEPSPSGRRGPRSAAPGPASRSPVNRGKRAPVTITISSSGNEPTTWQVAATIGARTAVRPTVVPPSRVWEIARSLGDAKLTAVVQFLLDEERRATQARADALSAQLSAVNEQLKLFPDKVLDSL